MQLSGLKTRFIRLPDGMTRINVKVKGAKETEINGSGPNITPEAMQALWDNLEELGEGDILVLAGSIPSSMPQDVYQQILARLDGRGIRFVVDATRDLLVKVLPYHPFLINPTTMNWVRSLAKSSIVMKRLPRLPGNCSSVVHAMFW